MQFIIINRFLTISYKILTENFKPNKLEKYKINDRKVSIANFHSLKDNIFNL